MGGPVLSAAHLVGERVVVRPTRGEDAAALFPLVHGRDEVVRWGDVLVEEDEGKVELPIAPDWANRPRQKICHERGKHALTHFRVLQRKDDRTRVLLEPVTGRSHQLRIHMRELGHPILGCDMYAHEEALNMAPRLMLHATTLEFEHPTTGEVLRGECLPDF